MKEGEKIEEIREILNLEPEELEEKKKLIIDKKNQVTLRIPSDYAFKAGLQKGDEFTVVLNPIKERLEKLLEKKPKIVVYIFKNGKE